MHLALKANAPGDAADGRDKAAELAQETQTLVELARLGAIDPDYLQASGTWAEGRWIAVRWIDGHPLWRSWAPARDPEGDRDLVRERLLTTTRTLAARLAALHTAGWTHADVQPTNTFVDHHGVAHVIDYALACGPEGARERRPYRGALTHTTAPEIASAILATSAGTHIPAAPAADIWGLGASLYWCWTGYRPVRYLDEVDRAEKLQAIAAGHTVALDTVRPWSFPVFEDLITACLAPDPTDRPTASDLVAQLEKAPA
ncbi:protein kinase domain-containing protein [Streptomyces sp. 8N616]|uniref:protein kinase domain-containing protein n=1 Tax=Streptomyces sp. 8N616 TaxID=3457414 RepID=UPI003FD52A03